jgi:hypothetical protein
MFQPQVDVSQHTTGVYNFETVVSNATLKNIMFQQPLYPCSAVAISHSKMFIR